MSWTKVTFDIVRKIGLTTRGLLRHGVAFVIAAISTLSRLGVYAST